MKWIVDSSLVLEKLDQFNWEKLVHTANICSEITAEIETQLKTVKNTTNIFAMQFTLEQIDQFSSPVQLVKLGQLGSVSWVGTVKFPSLINSEN